MDIDLSTYVHNAIQTISVLVFLKFLKKIRWMLLPLFLIRNCLILKKFKFRWRFVKVVHKLTKGQCSLIKEYMSQPNSNFGDLVPEQFYCVAHTDSNIDYFNNKLEELVKSMDLNKFDSTMGSKVEHLFSYMRKFYRTQRKPLPEEIGDLSDLINKGLLYEDQRGFASTFLYQKVTTTPLFQKVFC